jgi:hypothetical protein
MPYAEILALLKENGGYGIAVLAILFSTYCLKLLRASFDEIRKIERDRLADAKIVVETATKCAQALTNCSLALDLSSRSHVDSVASRAEFAKTLENFESALEINLKHFAERNQGTAELLKLEMGSLKSAFDTMRARVTA